jgi:endonuclease III
MGKNVVEVEQKRLKVVPKEFKVDVHHWLILHGRYTCVARKPRCGAVRVLLKTYVSLKIRVSSRHFKKLIE